MRGGEKLHTTITGPNGSGKTTIIKCILNMVQPDKGKITILGMDSVSDNLAVKSKSSMKKMKDLIAPMYPAWNDKVFCSYMKKSGLPESKKLRIYPGV